MPGGNAGQPFPGYGAPGASAVADAIAAGASTTLPRSDHVHGREAFGAIGNSAVGDAAANGVATTESRSDHKHGREAFGAVGNSAPADAAANGVATTDARSDHKHGRESYGASTSKATFHRLAATGAQVIANNTVTVLVCDSEDSDPSGSYNPATGVFTAPVTGTYQCSFVSLILTAAGDVANDNYLLALLKNGTNVAQLDQFAVSVAALVATRTLSGSIAIVANAGDTLTFAAYQLNAGAGNRNYGGANAAYMVGSVALCL